MGSPQRRTRPAGAGYLNLVKANPAMHERPDTAFIMVRVNIARHHSLSDGAVRLYLFLLDYAGASGQCWPEMATLEADMRCSNRTIYTYVRELEALGLLSTKRRGQGRSNSYTIGTSATAPTPSTIDPQPTAGLDPQWVSELDPQSVSYKAPEPDEVLKPVAGLDPQPTADAIEEERYPINDTQLVGAGEPVPGATAPAPPRVKRAKGTVKEKRQVPAKDRQAKAQAAFDKRPEWVRRFCTRMAASMGWKTCEPTTLEGWAPKVEEGLVSYSEEQRARFGRWLFSNGYFKGAGGRRLGSAFLTEVDDWKNLTYPETKLLDKPKPKAAGMSSVPVAPDLANPKVAEAERQVGEWRTLSPEEQAKRTAATQAAIQAARAARGATPYGVAPGKPGAPA